MSQQTGSSSPATSDNRDAEGSTPVAAGGMPENSDNLQNSPEECMGCKLVACTTPLIVSGYLMYQHSSTSKIAAMPFAAKWTGNRRWRLHFHRFNMMFTVPVGICYLAYSYIFRFGAFRLLDKKETPRPIQSLDDIQQKVREDTKADVDSFTKGTLELSDWLCSWYSEKKENTQNMLTRAKNVFSKSSEQPSQNPEDRK